MVKLKEEVLIKLISLLIMFHNFKYIKKGSNFLQLSLPFLTDLIPLNLYDYNVLKSYILFAVECYLLKLT